MNKEQNFISAVVYLKKGSRSLPFFETLYRILEEHFLQFELILLNPGLEEQEVNRLKTWARAVEKPVTVIHMPLLQRQEACMNAGLDLAIGDYIFEFDSAEITYPEDIIWRAYQLALEGNDVVSVCPSRISLPSRLFYRLFNRYSYAASPLRTNAFRLISRRALNRAHSINPNLFYRKAAYASCGLKMAEILYDGRARSGGPDSWGLAADCMVLYTDFGYKFSFGLALMMLFGTVLEMIYTIVIWLTGRPISGWTTTMFALTFGMTGLFAILAIVLRYLSLLVRLTFNHQAYLPESIEKL